MALIHVLDEVTANQIAAGEVVERPVNAVKEMVENAVDAGASDIEVEIADGGLTYIRVTDNGSGMSAEDAKLSIVITSITSPRWAFAERRWRAFPPSPARPSRPGVKKTWRVRSSKSRAGQSAK